MGRLLLTLSVLLVAIIFMGAPFVVATGHSDQFVASGGNAHAAPSVQGNSISNAGHVYTTASAHGNHFIGNLPLHENANATNKVIQSINVSKSPKGAAFDSSNGYVYVTNCCSDNVSVINGSTNKVIQSINVGKSPEGAAFDSSNGYVYVTNCLSDNVSVINGSTNKVIQSITVGLCPAWAAFDSSNGYVYVTNYCSDNVSVINGSTNKVIQSINVGEHPFGVEFDSSNGYVYVANDISDNVSVLGSVKYTVTVTETGLPTGTTWYVNITNGASYSSKTTTISFRAINGTYDYTVASMNKDYAPVTSSSTFTVNGKPVSVSVTFKAVTYTVTVTETGLPTGTTWYVNITGHDSGAITGTSYSFSLTNGTYSYTIGSNNTNYNANGSRVIINGHSKTISITFTASSSPSKSSHSGIPGIELYGIIGIAAAIVVAGSVLFIIRRKK